MAIARKPNRKPKPPIDEAAVDAFIAGAAKPEAAPIAAKLDELGWTLTEIWLTHHHPDHIGMAGWLMERFGAELWMSRTAWLMARMLILGEGGSKDPKEARVKYQQACDGGDMNGCYGLALAWEKGLGGKKSKKEGAALRQKACEGGMQAACK